MRLDLQHPWWSCVIQRWIFVLGECALLKIDPPFLGSTKGFERSLVCGFLGFVSVLVMQELWRARQKGLIMVLVGS